MAVKEKVWADVPHMFIEIVPEGKLSRGLLWLAEHEERQRQIRQINFLVMRQAAALLTSVL